MSKLVIETNIFLKSARIRRKNILKSQLASFKLEGIKISKSEASQIASKVISSLKKSS